jgi:hypothetical protein
MILASPSALFARAEHSAALQRPRNSATWLKPNQVAGEHDPPNQVAGEQDPTEPGSLFEPGSRVSTRVLSGALHADIAWWSISEPRQLMVVLRAR